ncbi:MAG: 3-dehydroquinate synthase, partial [Planctomycetes bacterium]|nr:3-dehydroquinate synthase [Planctomycetota bacterium]
GFAPRSVVVPRGEAAKTAAQLSALWEGLLEAGVQRDTPVVALGGGAASDAIGFAAATLLRGVPWVAVPTTLLGMVDAGLGGKTAIDLPQGKNLAGAFAPPRAVLLDPECLATLPPGTPPGMAEVLKHALIADPALWSELGRRAGRGDPRRALGADLLLRSARVKLDCVAEDPFDRGVRRTLNLGHTFAHGLERAADYALSHGHAVAVGLVAAAAVSEAQGYAEPGLRAEIEAGLERWGLPTRFPARWLPAAAEALRRDKKARGEQVEAILLHEVGCAARAWLPFEALEDGLERVAYSGNSMSRSDATPVLAASPERSSRSPTAPRLAKP